MMALPTVSAVLRGTTKIRNGHFLAKWGEMGMFLAKWGKKGGGHR